MTRPNYDPLAQNVSAYVVTLNGQEGVITKTVYTCGCGTKFLSGVTLSRCTSCGRSIDWTEAVPLDTRDIRFFTTLAVGLKAIREAIGSRQCTYCFTWHSVEYKEDACSSCGANLGNTSQVATIAQPSVSTAASPQRRRRVTVVQAPNNVMWTAPTQNLSSGSSGLQTFLWVVGVIAALAVLIGLVWFIYHQYFDVADTKPAYISYRYFTTGYEVQREVTQQTRNTTATPAFGAYDITQSARRVQITQLVSTKIGEVNAQVTATSNGVKVVCGGATRLPNGDDFRPVCTQTPAVVTIRVPSDSTPVYGNTTITVYYYDFTENVWIHLEDRSIKATGQAIVTPTFIPSPDLRIRQGSEYQNLTLVLRVNDQDLEWPAGAYWSLSDETSCTVGYNRAGKAIELKCP